MVFFVSTQEQWRKEEDLVRKSELENEKNRSANESSSKIISIDDAQPSTSGTSVPIIEYPPITVNSSEEDFESSPEVSPLRKRMLGIDKYFCLSLRYIWL